MAQVTPVAWVQSLAWELTHAAGAANIIIIINISKRIEDKLSDNCTPMFMHHYSQ